MKKLFCTLLVMLLAVTGMACADTPDFTGDWYADVFGQVVHMTLNADGTSVITMFDQTDNDVWFFDGENIIFGTDPEYYGEAIYDPVANTLTMDDIAVFTREVVEPWVPADVIADAAKEDFNGTYNGFRIGAGGLYLDLSALDASTKIVIDDAHMLLSVNENQPEQFDLVYENGVLSTIADEEGTVYTVQKLADGSIAMSFEMMGTMGLCYCMPAAE